MTGSGKRAESLGLYAALVRSWAPRLDLVSPRDLERFVERHIEDSLRAEALVGSAPAGPCADVGSGAGLPGVPLAIAAPDRHWRLIEPRKRRAAFLEEVVRQLDLRAEVVVMTAGDAAQDSVLAGSHALVVARALARPRRAFELIMPLVAPEGIGAVFVGEDAEFPEIATEWIPGVAIIRRGTGEKDW